MAYPSTPATEVVALGIRRVFPSTPATKVVALGVRGVFPSTPATEVVALSIRGVAHGDGARRLVGQVLVYLAVQNGVELFLFLLPPLFVLLLALGPLIPTSLPRTMHLVPFSAQLERL